MAKEEPQKIGDIIEALKSSSELGKQLEQARIWEQWDSLVGKEFCAHATPVSIQDDVLRVELDSAVWMHKFSYSKSDLIARINSILEHISIVDIFITLKIDEPPPDLKNSP